MIKYWMTTLIVLSSIGSFAQSNNNDSLFVGMKGGRAMVYHEIGKDENLYIIAQQYSVPAVVLSQNNDISFYEKLESGRKIMIPMGNYNYLKSNPENSNTIRPIFYKLQNRDSYSTLSNSLGISEELLKMMNGNIAFNQLHGTINMGYIRYQPAEKTSTANGVRVTELNPISTPVATLTSGNTDTVKGPPSELEKIYNYQTTNELYLDSLAGMVVFFKPQTTVNNKLLYAFSNDITKGRVVKVVNPSNQKFIFAKVIGPLPATKQYINAKIGLDGRARAELETREVKLWCGMFFKY